MPAASTGPGDEHHLDEYRLDAVGGVERVVWAARRVVHSARMHAPSGGREGSRHQPTDREHRRGCLRERRSHQRQIPAAFPSAAGTRTRGWP
jgi:hypothetical protein